MLWFLPPHVRGAGRKGFPLDPPLLLLLKESARASWGKKNRLSFEKCEAI